MFLLPPTPLVQRRDARLTKSRVGSRQIRQTLGGRQPTHRQGKRRPRQSDADVHILPHQPAKRWTGENRCAIHPTRCRSLFKTGYKGKSAPTAVGEETLGQ
eukprot:CAMPEP_0117569512 /NCGR_PEP_ID=MMETSP0784-20121206/58695_1 /TAXON_ID=39447 /ORGANISM="" /LENGTH=100 /DNA_ID=CAMNT_0005367485 /DNA_START=1 /DNA_END=303 /DNA_ORIENTATION=+